MHELMLMLASVLPQEEMLNELKKAIAEHDDEPGKEKFKNIEMWCMMILGKTAVDSQGGDPVNMIKRMDKMKRGNDLLLPTEQ